MDSILACGAGGCAFLAAMYRFARPHFSISVNCHFCGQNSQVPYSDYNSFVCKICEQYNGFNEDGDYNKELEIEGKACRYVKECVQMSAKDNGLCRNCNLNQELKISQLAKFPKGDEELDEYKEHLERVYRLCAACEDVVASKLSDQDRKLASNVIAYNLERSRLSNKERCRPRHNLWLPVVQCILSIGVFSLLQEYEEFHVPLNIKNAILSLGNNSGYGIFNSVFPLVTLGEALVPLTGMVHLLTLPFMAILLLTAVFNKAYFCGVLNAILAITYWLQAPHIIQLSIAGIGVITTVLSTPPSPNNTIITNNGGSHSFSKFEIKKINDCQEVDDTFTQNLIDQDEERDVIQLTPIQSDKKLENINSTDSENYIPASTSALMKTGNEFSFTHEFATQCEDDDCDLSSLSLGEISTASKPRNPPFRLSQYSPVTSANSLFSPSRPVLHPARLTNTSWVAGGYWTPPSHVPLHSPSRTSSLSSGFVSGTPSLINGASPAGSLLNYSPSSNSNYPLFTPEVDRFSIFSGTILQSPQHKSYSPSVVGSSPQSNMPSIDTRRPTLDDRLSDYSLDRRSQTSQTSQTSKSLEGKKHGWSLTITITPTGLLLATSIAVNVGLAVLWLRQSAEDH